MTKRILAIVAVMLSSPIAHAASLDGYYLGLGLYAQNSFDKTTKTDDGAGALLGAYSFPVAIRYVQSVSGSWSIAPALLYTPIPRSSGGSTATTTFLHLSIPASYEWSGNSREFEFFVGPGLSMYSMKGAGGTKQLSNGTGTSTYAVPGGTSTSKLVTLDFGAAWNENPHRLSFEIFVEGAASEKRSFNLLATYMYHFGGGR